MLLRLSNVHRWSLRARLSGLGAIALVELLAWWIIQSFGWNEALAIGSLITWVVVGSGVLLSIAAVFFVWSRYRFRFNTKYLLIAVLAISIPMAYFGSRLRTYVSDVFLARKLVASGIASVAVDDDYGVQIQALKEHQTHRPISGRISEISLSEDASVLEIGDILLDMPNCKEISLGGPKITNAGLSLLADTPEARQITSLSLFSTNITDEGLGVLANMRQLKVLWLSAHTITDAGLAHLEVLSSLEVLGLIDNGMNGNPTRIDGTGLVHLRGLTNLKQVRIQGLQVSDVALEHLASLPSLQTLSICEATAITNVGLDYLSESKSLKSLYIRGCKVDDQGLKPIVEMTSLERIYFINTQVTNEGIYQLMDGLPNCEITRED